MGIYLKNRKDGERRYVGPRDRGAIGATEINGPPKAAYVREEGSVRGSGEW